MDWVRERLGDRVAVGEFSMVESWWIVVGAAGAAALYLLVWRPVRLAVLEARLARARRGFHVQRERLEAKFVQLASADAKPSGPHWDDCDFDDDVAYVRNRKTGELSAFVAVTVAIDDYDIDDYDPDDGLSLGAADLLRNLHAGTAVFRLERDGWVTDGRAILNLTPSEAIRFYHNDLEIVDQELAQRPIL
jgi:hypothetical protein